MEERMLVERIVLRVIEPWVAQTQQAKGTFLTSLQLAVSVQLWAL